MFRTKKDVDRHVKDIFRKLTNENETNLRSYNIAKLYYQVGDYESAKRYVSNYLEVRSKSEVAHKLLGQIHEALGQKEAALAEYKISLELEGRQEELVLKVCELLADLESETDVNKIKYWVERANKQYPHHPTVFQLKEKLLTIEKPSKTGEDLEALIASELSVRPKDINLRVKLIEHYTSKQRFDDAYKHVCQVEETHGYRNSVVWYQTVSDLLTKCKENKQSDWSFWVLYVGTLERYAALALKEQGSYVKKTVSEATQAVFNFDQNLMELKRKNFTNNTAFTNSIISHMSGQLNFHLACLLLKNTKREQGNWAETGRLCAPLFLTALHVSPMNPSSQWALHLKDSLKNQIQLWYKEGSYRCSQSGHVLQDYARDDVKKLMDKVDKFCTSSWKERIYQRIFANRIYQRHMANSYFTKSDKLCSPLLLCSKNELKQYDEVSEEVWPNSLHHQVWIGVNSKPDKGNKSPRPHIYSHIFPQLQLTAFNLSQAAPDSLSRLDIDAFLNSTVLCSLIVMEEQQLNSFLSPDKLPTLPADLTNTLCTVAQEKWWDLAYQMYSRQESAEGDIGEIRRELQNGLEVIRCIGNHGLHPKLLVHLGRIFNHRAKLLKKEDANHNDIPALEARSELYWSTAIPLLERLQNNQTIRMAQSKLFNYQGKEMNMVELGNAIEEGKLLLAQRVLREEQYEEAIQTLQGLKCPEASFQQGKIYKILADELVNSMPRESLTSELRSQRVIMLAKTRNCYYLTLDRLRSPGINPNHPLNSELDTAIADIENELKRIDPDMPRGEDLNTNDCDGVSDESYSSANSALDPPMNSLGVTTINTPQKSMQRNPKRSSTPFKPQNQGIFDLTKNRTEARPSPERLDAQIRQMIHSRDNLMHTIIEQNSGLMNSMKVLLDKVEGLTKEMAELRKESQRQQTQQSINLEEDLYHLREEDYGDMGYRSNRNAPIANNFLAQPHNQPYAPMVYPSTTFPTNYYQPLNQYPPNMFQLGTVLPFHNQPRIPDNLQLQSGLFTPRLQTRLPDMLPPVNQLPPMQLSNKLEMPKNDTPLIKEPPVNVVITTSDILPTTVPLTQPTWSVTVPVQYRLGGTPGPAFPASTATISEPSNVPHNYQISMPEQATIPTTVNLPSLSTTFTTTPPVDLAKLQTPSQENKSANNSNDVIEQEHDPIPDFVPVIPLPAEVKVTTGEEGETTLYCARAKLFRFVDQEWKERGVGDVKLLRNEEGKVRLLMRRECILKICANHLLRPDMELKPMLNNNKAWMWVASDFADEEVKLETLCIRFKTTEEALSFKEQFDQAKSSLHLSPDKTIDIDDEVINQENVEEAQVPENKDSTVVGGFSFTSKPIIQEKSETIKKNMKTPEPAKINPFSGFKFMSDEQSPAKPFESITSPSSVTQQGGFTFGKSLTNTPELKSSLLNSTAHSGEGATPLRRPYAPPLTCKTSSTTVDQPKTDEAVLFEEKARLTIHVKDSQQPKDDGIFKINIFLGKELKKLRLTMCKENSNVVYAHNILENMKFNLKNNNSVQWIVKEDGKSNTYLASFETWELATEFQTTLRNNQMKTLPREPIKKQEKVSSSPKITKTTQQVPLPQLFKPPAGSWACDGCYIRNQETAKKCVCCDTPCPNAVSSSDVASESTVSSTVSSSDNGKQSLAEIFKRPAGSWECNTCCVVNNVSNNYCNACESPKDPSMPPKSLNTGGILGTASSATFLFGIPKELNKTPTNSPFTFPTSEKTTPISFGIANPNSRFEFGSPGKSFDFQFQAKSPVKSPGEIDETSEEEVAESEDVYFPPVIPLPDKVDVKTGEENEEILYSHRAKLFRFDSGTVEWKERGLGDIKLLKNKDTQKLRLIMRREVVLKLCLNHILTNDIEFTPKDEKTWLWSAADYTDNEMEYNQFACRFKTPEIAQNFKQAIDDARAGKEKKEIESSSTQDIQVLYEITVTPEEKAAALKLQLPENFYAYKQKEDCPGCLGCKEPDIPIFSDNLTEKLPTGDTPKIFGNFVTPKTTQSTTNIFPTTPIEQSPLTTSIFGNSTCGDKSASVFSFGSSNIENAKNKTSHGADSTTSSLDNLKICSPSIAFQSQQQQPAGVKFDFGLNLSNKMTSTNEVSSPVFGNNSLNLNKSAQSTNSDDKSSTMSRNIFSGLPPSTTNSSAFGPLGTPIFGSSTTTSNISIPSPASTVSSFGVPSDPGEPLFGNVFGFSSKPIFAGSPMTNLSFGNTALNTTSTITTPTNTFGTVISNDTGKKEGLDFLTASKDTVTFSALAATAPQQQVFKADPNFKFAGAGATVFGSKPNSNNAITNTPKKEQLEENDEEEKENCEENDNEEEHDPQFEPIVPLPATIEVRTGEEEELKVFCERAKLYRYDKATKEWKERGVGDMKILYHKDHGTYRLLLRREKVHKVVCNFLLKPDVQFSPLKTSDRAYIWAGMNYAEDNGILEKLAIKFKSQELAREFIKAVGDAQRAMEESHLDDEKYVEDEEDYEEDEDDADGEYSIVFAKRATVYAKPDNTDWELLADGMLKIYYDSEIFCERIMLKSSESGEIFTNTVICMESKLQVVGNECTWYAFDQVSNTPRTLKAIFSSAQAAIEMHKEFQEGIGLANQVEVHELIDDYQNYS